MCFEEDRRRINATEMDVLRRSARISKLYRKTNEYIRIKMDAKATGLDDITRKKTHLVWTCWENEPNAISKNYFQLKNCKKRGRP
jgi:hypothetical protein